MKKNFYNIAIIGCGRISGHHLKSIELADGLNISAVCDLNENKAKEYAKEFDIPFFVNYHEMFNKLPEIDLVVIATPSGMHFEHSIEIMNLYNKHLIVEKPTFMRTDQLIEAFNLAENKGLNIYPVFQNRYNIAVQRVKKSIIEKELGEIRIINVRLRWCRPQRYYDLSEWRGTFSHDGGAISNQGIHHIDLLRYLGGEIESVNAIMRTMGAEIEVEDSVVSTFTYHNGSIGSLEITTAARPDDFEASISIVGSKGLAQLGGVAVNNLEIFTPKPNDTIRFSDDFSDLPDRGRVYGRGHMKMYEDISNSLINGEPYPVNKEDCFNTISLLHSFYSSDEISSSIKIKDNIQSKRLGKINENISELYRTKK